ncbi:MAG TPA: globin domain-containing protein [Chitinophagaceae bacterium]|jgi:nitric oxide dioxygenase|nr:globin domain-containing protein [Chitinophagaceae bacterium]
MMNETQIAIIKKSWRFFRSIDPAVVGDAFYSKLFMDNPVLRKMFPSRMEEQYKKLMDMLNTIIARLDNLDALNEDIIAMAQRHVQYGVRPAHYKLVGAALLWTLQQGLGPEWTPEVKEAWSSCYNKLSAVMIAASGKQSV